MKYAVIMSLALIFVQILGWLVCRLSPELEESLTAKYPKNQTLFAVFEAPEEIKVKFDREARDWTVVEVCVDNTVIIESTRPDEDEDEYDYGDDDDNEDYDNGENPDVYYDDDDDYDYHQEDQ